jgi:hypothetical protein
MNALSYQLSAISYQLSDIGYQLEWSKLIITDFALPKAESRTP